ncbi:MAG: hypothetical protein ACR2O7_09580 [Parasphingorhabdus sp.]
MAKERILIAVKTYPTLSKKYIELVCTAGFREDGSWVRIYPSPFRFLGDDQKYKKYQWIDIELEKNPRDSRPESYRPINIDDITLGEVISTGHRRDWYERKRFILGNNRIYTNLQEVIDGAKNDAFSLAIFKPTEILQVTSEKVSDSWGASREEAAKESLKQGSLFADTATASEKVMPKLPYKFSYRFRDDHGKVSKLMIEDWEIGQLYWGCFKKGGEEYAVQKVKEKYWDDFAKTKDLHLFLGTTYKFHKMSAPNPYVIIGTFHPPYDDQLSLL